MNNNGQMPVDYGEHYERVGQDQPTPGQYMEQPEYEDDEPEIVDPQEGMDDQVP
jgi:hypothetical protein